MSNFNRVVIAGRLTHDPEMRFAQVGGEGVPVTDFQLAIDRKPGSDESAADFIPVTAWRKTAENLANYKAKGDPVLIEGRLRYESWQTDEGFKRSKVKVEADNIQFLPRSGGQSNGSSEGQRATGTEEEADFNDLPF